MRFSTLHHPRKNVAKLSAAAVVFIFLASGGIAHADASTPDTIRKTYNQGCELYRQKEFQASEKLFAEVAVQTADETLEQKALYNQGTALLAGLALAENPSESNDVAAAISQSIELFEDALDLDPTDLDAKKNLERAIHLMVSKRIRYAQQLIQAADPLLAEFKAKEAQENYTQAKDQLLPIFNDFSPNNPEAIALKNQADQQLQMLEKAIRDTKKEMEAAQKAINTYDYRTAADLMRDNKPTRKLAFDLDEDLAQEFQQLIQNNQNIIEIIYPANPLKL